MYIIWFVISPAIADPEWSEEESFSHHFMESTTRTNHSCGHQTVGYLYLWVLNSISDIFFFLNDLKENLLRCSVAITLSCLQKINLSKKLWRFSPKEFAAAAAQKKYSIGSKEIFSPQKKKKWGQDKWIVGIWFFSQVNYKYATGTIQGSLLFLNGIPRRALRLASSCQFSVPISRHLTSFFSFSEIFALLKPHSGWQTKKPGYL